jgi:hypothetical protein
MSVISFDWTDIPIKTRSGELSGLTLGAIGIFHQGDTESLSPVCEDVLFVIARNLEREAMTVHIDVDHLIVTVDDIDRRFGE